METHQDDCYSRWDCKWKRRHRDETCPLHDSSPDKDATKFRQALSDISQTWVIGSSPFQLRGVVFPSSISGDLFSLLGNGQFELQLSSATFWGQVNFAGKTFQKEIDLDGSTFKDLASFQESQFKLCASFIEATFERDAVFAGTIFEDPAYFDRIRCERGDFALAQFKSMASFRGQPGQNIFAGAKEAIFDEARFFKPDLVRLAYADFGRCSLLNTDLRGIDFSGVRWSEQGKWSKHVVPLCANMSGTLRLSSIRVAGGGDAPHHAC